MAVLFEAVTLGLWRLSTFSAFASLALLAPVYVAADDKEGRVRERKEVVTKNGTVELDRCRADCKDPCTNKLTSTVGLEDRVEVQEGAWATIEFCGLDQGMVSFDASIGVKERLDALEIQLDGPGRLNASFYRLLSAGYAWLTSNRIIMGLRGTVVDLEVLGDGSAVVKVYEGEVRLYDDEPTGIDSSHLKIHQGNKALISADGTLLQQSPIGPFDSPLSQDPSIAGPRDSHPLETAIPRIFTRDF